MARNSADPGRPCSISAPGSGRSSVFELAILGLLADTPMHGYELRQRSSATLGSLRMFSYGSLYPMLRRLEAAGSVTTDPENPDPDAIPLTSKRSRVVYRLTAAGKERLADHLGDAGPQSWSDEGFEVHLAFFSRTSADARIRILEGRRRRVEERRERLRTSLTRSALAKAAGRIDDYTEQLRRLGLESSDREVRWLDELIDTEKKRQPDHDEPVAADQITDQQ